MKSREQLILELQQQSNELDHYYKILSSWTKIDDLSIWGKKIKSTKPTIGASNT